MKISRNSRVTLQHQLGLTDGTVLEDSFEGEPMTIQLGRGELAEGLELALIDLEDGDEQTIDIGPDLAFGYPDPEAIHELPRSEFREDAPLEPGVIMEFSLPNGETLPGTILEADDQRVRIDFNHPLAGETVRYRVRILSVEEPEELH